MFSEGGEISEAAVGCAFLPPLAASDKIGTAHNQSDGAFYFFMALIAVSYNTARLDCVQRGDYLS